MPCVSSTVFKLSAALYHFFILRAMVDQFETFVVKIGLKTVSSL